MSYKTEAAGYRKKIKSVLERLTANINEQIAVDLELEDAISAEQENEAIERDVKLTYDEGQILKELRSAIYAAQYLEWQVRGQAE